MDFSFDGEKKLSLIRALVGQRMRRASFDGMDYQLEVDRLGGLQLIGTPEGGIVTIVETVIKMTSQGAPLSQIIESIESHRKHLGHSKSKFREIINIAKGALPDPCLSIYCRYRISFEHNALLTPSEVDSVMVKAFNEIRKSLPKVVHKQAISVEKSGSTFDVIYEYSGCLLISGSLGMIFGGCGVFFALIFFQLPDEKVEFAFWALAISFGVISIIRRWDKIYIKLV